MSDPSTESAADPAESLIAEAVSRHQAGDLAAAAEDYRRAIALVPGRADLHYNLGLALHALGRLREAHAAYTGAVVAEPGHVSAHYNLGVLLQGVGQPGQAVDMYRRAIALDPAHVNAHNNLGASLASLGRAAEALEAYLAVVALAPAAAQARFNLGNAYMALGRPDDALVAYQEGLSLAPDSAELLGNLGNALQALGRIGEAGEAYAQAVALKPSLVQADSNRLLCLLYDPEVTSQALLAAHRAWDTRHGGQGRGAWPAPAAPPSARPLRVGYVSGDLYRHPVGYFLARVLEAHDGGVVAACCYPTNGLADDMTARLRAASSRWRSLSGVSDEAAAAMIEADGVDILVDLSGHTAGNRLPLFTRRPAPVQASWLGYPSTTGVSAIDYLLMDRITLPEGAERWCSEAVVRLGDSRFCYDPPALAPAPTARPAGAPVIFGSFNNLTKVGPEVVALWAAVLAATPGSRLVVKWKSLDRPVVRAGLADAFARAGVAPDRLDLRGASAHGAMLAEYGDIDIALDPFPFCGGLTSCEALWMGVPVVTLPGDRPASRQTLGFLSAVGLADLAADRPADYVRIAADLAADPERRAALRQGLRLAMANSALCDGPGFTRRLEAAFQEMWRRHAQGGRPDHFAA